MTGSDAPKLGITKLIWPGETNNRGKLSLPDRTVTPASVVGSGLPCVAVAVVGARFCPKTAAMEPKPTAPPGVFRPDGTRVAAFMTPRESMTGFCANAMTDMITVTIAVLVGIAAPMAVSGQ